MFEARFLKTTEFKLILIFNSFLMFLLFVFCFFSLILSFLFRGSGLTMLNGDGGSLNHLGVAMELPVRYPASPQRSLVPPLSGSIDALIVVEVLRLRFVCCCCTWPISENLYFSEGSFLFDYEALIPRQRLF